MAAAKPTDEAAPLRCGLAPMHPGEWLREEVLPALKAAGVPRTEVASALGVSRRTLYDLLEEKASVSPEMAFKLCAVLGGSPQFWAGMQMTFDLAQAARKREGQPAERRLRIDAAS